MTAGLRGWLGVAAASGLLALGLAAAVPAPAQAATGITQTGPAEVGNLLDYANSDFEGSIGNWVGVSNATLTDDTGPAFLHEDSLLDTAASAGTSTFKLGNGATAVQIGVTAQDTYRVGAYFKAPAVSGQTVQFSLGCYSAQGVWGGWQLGTVNSLLNTTKWQYSEDDIKVPAGCAYVLGSPEVTLGGLAAGAAVNMDEAIFAPKRAALIIGAHGENSGGGYDAADWISTNATIGPLQSDKEFYDGNVNVLPATWNSSTNNCYEIEQQTPNPANWPACVMAYKTQRSPSQFATFFQALPPQQMVIMVYHQEAEGDYTSGSQFVSEFETQAQNIRSGAGNAPNVFVAMDSATYQYGTQSNDDAGTGCSYIVPTSYTDFYLADHYDQGANGASLPGETSGPPGDSAGQKWSNWLKCVQSINKPLGLAEYGLDCTTNPDQQVVTNEMASDKTYLGAIPGATEPTIMWEYWYSDAGTSSPGCVFDNSAGGITQWQSIETQNGGG